MATMISGLSSTCRLRAPGAGKSKATSRGRRPRTQIVGSQPAPSGQERKGPRHAASPTAPPGTRAVVAALILAMTGCQRPLRPIFEPPAPPMTWPADPAQARVRYVGALKSSADLKAPRKPFEGLARLFVGARSPDLLYGPRALVASRDAARIWVADPGGRCLHLFDLQHRSYRKIDRPGGERLLSPTGLCAGPEDTIFVCDSEAGAIYQLSDRTGDLRRRVLLTDDVKRPAALTYRGETAELFLVDVAGHDVKVLDLEGRIVRSFGRRGREKGEFNFPCAIAADGALLWVADAGNQRVQGVTYEGDAIVAFGEAGDAPGQMALPKGIAVDKDGNVYVIDARFENIQVFDRAGNLLLVLGEEGVGPGQFWLPGGIFIGADDRIWVCDTYNRRVQVFERIRRSEETAGAAASGVREQSARDHPPSSGEPGALVPMNGEGVKR